ncbi:MAG: hypothetical protein WBX25_13480 [Rhodomicrobium sp.]
MNHLINRAQRFLDLYSDYRPSHAIAHAAGSNKLAGWRQALVWLGCALGVLLGPYALAAAGGNYPEFAVIFGSGNRLFWAAVFGVVLTALLFHLKFVTPSSPLVVQIGIAVLAGFASRELIPKAIDWIVSALPVHAGTF